MIPSDWLASIPRTFPAKVNHVTTYHNPLIGETQYDTIHAVYGAAKLLENIALSCTDQTYGLELGKSATGGLVGVLQCMAGALAFELKHRESNEPQRND